MEEVLETFQPLAHRLENVGTVNGADCINDSIATSPEASIAAIQAFAGKRIFLIAGGSDKGLDYSVWGNFVREKVHKVFLIGAIQEKMANAIGSAENIFLANSLEEAVTQAKSELEPADILLLSPATASYDSFSDFRERGEKFKNLIREFE
jgi:UDP-N-acetylmuramoylalanine--D-glutamate ligase